jgi:hypothetical protein
MTVGAADMASGASRGGAAGWAGGATVTAATSGAAGIAVAAAIGAGAITDATDGATAGTQAGISGGAGSIDTPPSMLARLAKEASDARKNAACDSAMARWKTAWASAVWRWLS